MFKRSEPSTSGECEASEERGDGEDELEGLQLSDVFWPQDLLPTKLPNFRVLTWGYDVDIDHALSGASTATIFQHAGNLLSDLADARVSKEAEKRPLVFVAHSLGGIVVKDVSGNPSVT